MAAAARGFIDGAVTGNVLGLSFDFTLKVDVPMENGVATFVQNPVSVFEKAGIALTADVTLPFGIGKVQFAGSVSLTRFELQVKASLSLAFVFSADFFFKFNANTETQDLEIELSGEIKIGLLGNLNFEGAVSKTQECPVSTAQECLKFGARASIAKGLVGFCFKGSAQAAGEVALDGDFADSRISKVDINVAAIIGPLGKFDFDGIYEYVQKNSLPRLAFGMAYDKTRGEVASQRDGFLSGIFTAIVGGLFKGLSLEPPDISLQEDAAGNDDNVVVKALRFMTSVFDIRKIGVYYDTNPYSGGIGGGTVDDPFPSSSGLGVKVFLTLPIVGDIDLKFTLPADFGVRRRFLEGRPLNLAEELEFNATLDDWHRERGAAHNVRHARAHESRALALYDEHYHDRRGLFDPCSTNEGLDAEEMMKSFLKKFDSCGKMVKALFGDDGYTKTFDFTLGGGDFLPFFKIGGKVGVAILLSNKPAPLDCDLSVTLAARFKFMKLIEVSGNLELSPIGGVKSGLLTGSGTTDGILKCPACPSLEGSVRIEKKDELQLIPSIKMAVDMQFIGLNFIGNVDFDGGSMDPVEPTPPSLKAFKIMASVSTTELIELVVGGITKAITGSEASSGNLIAIVFKNIFKWLSITVKMSLEYKGGFDFCFGLAVSTDFFERGSLPDIELCTGNAISALGDVKDLLVAKGKDFALGLLNGIDKKSIDFDTSDFIGQLQVCTPKIGTKPSLKMCGVGFGPGIPCGFTMGGTTLVQACMTLPELAIEASVKVGPNLRFEVGFKVELNLGGGSLTVLGRTLRLKTRDMTFGPHTFTLDFSKSPDLCTLVPAIKALKIPGIRFPAWTANFPLGFTATFDPSAFGLYTKDNYLIDNMYGGQCPQIGL